MTEDIYGKIVQMRLEGLRGALAIVIAHKGASPRKDAAKMLVYEDGRQIGGVGGGLVEEAVCRTARSLIASGKSRLLTFDLSNIDHDERALVCGGSMQIYVESILPDPELFIFGAGHVAQAVSRAAEPLGFRITVLDDRPQYTTKDRFPRADVILLKNWEAELAQRHFTESGYYFIATQRPQTDQICLRFAALAQAKYIGMLGSLRKTELLFKAMQKQGVPPEDLKRVCIPAGFDIDSETPEEIAVSVVAELAAARKNLDIHSMRKALRQIKNSPPEA